MNVKNGQSKTTKSGKPKTRIVHVAIPLPIFHKIKKDAEAAGRSVNWKLSTLIVSAYAD
jgi:hypothetical protein